MRISENSIVQEFLLNLENSRKRWFELSRQVSTGKKLHEPSDNPGDSARIIRVRDEFSRINQYLRNMSRADSKLGTTSSALNTLRNLTVVVAEKAGYALTGTTSQEGRNAIALELRGILENMEQVAATTVDGLYIFSGSKVDTPPVTKVGDAYVYQGDAEVLEIEVTVGEQIRVNLTGPEVFSDPASDLLNTMAELIQQLESGDLEAARQSLGTVADAGKVIDVARFKISKSLQQAENGRLRLQDRLADLTSEVSELEDANMAESISRMIQAETVLNVSLGAGARSRQANLFDYIG